MVNKKRIDPKWGFMKIRNSVGIRCRKLYLNKDMNNSANLKVLNGQIKSNQINVTEFKI